MPLTADDHQKVSALQQIANVVSQLQSVQGNPVVTANAVNNLLPLIQRFESSDPDFQELGMWLRQARASGPQGPAPHVISNIAAQVQHMVGKVGAALPARVNEHGDRTMWDPTRGHVSSPLLDPNEPLKPNSVYDWRGSKKYPMGKAFPDWNVIEGFDSTSTGLVMVGVVAIVICYWLLK